MKYLIEISPDKFYDIPSFEGIYKMNSLGQVYSHERQGSNLSGDRFLTHSLDGNRYYKIGLSKNGKLRNVRIHILLARMFIPNPNNYPFVRHLNDIKTDNRLENLAWGTQADNAKDSIRNGTFSFRPTGVKHHWFGKHRLPPNKGVKGSGANNNKIILDQNSGIFYYGTQDAANAKCINASSLRVMLSGHGKNKTSLVYV